MKKDSIDFISGGHKREFNQWENEYLLEKGLEVLSTEFPFIYCMFKGMTQQEIAQICNCPVGTNKSRIYYGMKKLRKWFEEMGVVDNEKLSNR